MNNTTLSLCVHNKSAQKLVPHSCNSGISLSSFFEHKYSPRTTIEIIPITWMIHQSQVDGNPPYIVHVTICIKKSVTEKSRHFLDFSTIIASNTALLNGDMSVLHGRWDVIIYNIHSLSPYNLPNQTRHENSRIVNPPIRTPHIQILGSKYPINSYTRRK